MGCIYDESSNTTSSSRQTDVDLTDVEDTKTRLCDDQTYNLNMAEGGVPCDSPIPNLPPPPAALPRSGQSIVDESNACETNSGPYGSGDGNSFEMVDIAEEVLTQIENNLEKLEDIPDICDNIPIECFTENTQVRLCYLLDPESKTVTLHGLPNDYLGFGEWIGLENLFMKYLHRTIMKLKTIEVLGKWITLEGEPRPTIGNFKTCMVDGIDRPDVVMELAKLITKDAIAWVRTGSEACTVAKAKTDKSWQLTRHDVVTGKRTFYTCCLVYADEDEGMALIIHKLYKSVSKEALFFLPQFDLKVGKYEFDATAKVIQERCEGRVVFILSEYFFASEVCRFAVNFSRAIDASADAGNLIPFHLTNKYNHVPRVLKGISGIRWFRRAARTMSLSMMADTILGGRTDPTELEKLKDRMMRNIESDPSTYLCDPPYDQDTPSPGPPIDVDDPPLSEEMSAKYDPEPLFEQIESSPVHSTKEISKSKQFLKGIKKRITNAVIRVFKINKLPRFESSEIIDDQQIVNEATPDSNSQKEQKADIDSIEQNGSSGGSNLQSGTIADNASAPSEVTSIVEDSGSIKSKCFEVRDVNEAHNTLIQGTTDAPVVSIQDSEGLAESLVNKYSLEDSITTCSAKHQTLSTDNINENTQEEASASYLDKKDDSECLVSTKVEFHRTRSEPVENDESII